MPAAFVFATFGFGSVLTFLLDHVVALSGLGLGVIAIACIALAILVPAALPFLRAALDVVLKGLTWLITTTAGAFIIVAVVCFLAGFWTHSFLDKEAELRTQIEAQRAATAAAQAIAAQARQQAVALDQVNAAASRRAEAAEVQSADLQAQVDAYAADPDLDAPATKGTPSKAVCSRALTASDVAALTRIGAPRAATR